MKAFLSRLDFQKLALLAVLAAIITLMVAPNLNLVPARYEEGNIITQDIIIKDNVILEDERSTNLRRQQAVSDFPPIFDYDHSLTERTLGELTAAFKGMRDALAALRQQRAEMQGKIRRNELEQLSAISFRAVARQRSPILSRERNLIIGEIGQLNDEAKLSPSQVLRLEKLRFDLRAVEAHLTQNAQAIEQLAKRLEQAKKEALAQHEAYDNTLLDEDQVLAKLRADFDKRLRVTTDPSEFGILKEAQFNPEFEKQIVALLAPVLGQKVVSTPESLPANRNTIQIHDLASKKVERFENLAAIIDVQQVRTAINKAGQALEMPGDRAAQRETVISIAQKLVQPNLTENKGQTERQKQEVIDSLSPVYFNLKTGDVVARAGDAATAQQVEFINALNAYNLKNPQYPQLIGTFIIVLLALVLLYQVIVLRSSGSPLRFSQMLLVSILMVATLLLAQAILAFVPALTTLYDFFPGSSYRYFIPAALTAMLGSILLGFEIAILLGFATSLFLAILLGNSLGFFIYAMLGSLVAAIPMRHYDTRYALWQQGLRISAVNLPVLVVLTLLDQNRLSLALAFDLGAGLINGLGVAFLVSTILPLLERAFDITTNMRLLELSNMNHPALKELAVRAPGTYHHSIVVGNLSESAAGGIQANPLLVRVASYYHDLGKMLCPLYFVENQMQANYHDDLPAKTSTRIIINHVKDGLELAKRHRLGKAITEILAQHHGTSLVRYFYHKAESEQPRGAEKPQELEYRYPGPKPTSKEAGLVMVADVTEAATRSLEDPSAESVREMVQKLTTNIYMDGQLDESGMTFNDLNFIEKTFTKMLLSIHHHRITYPDLKIAAKGAPEGEEEAPSPDDEPTDQRIVARRRASR
jgi:putative nucleotidyltransferase with HDIG domain